MNQFKDVIAKRDDINAWIDQQNAFVTDIASKPSKLRPDAAAQDLQTINDVLQGINEKRNIVLTELSNQCKLYNDI